MKSNLIFIVFIVLTLPLTAQNNIFPSSGNVGIGTLSPVTKLHVVKENSGINSIHAAFVMEAIDAQLDLTSTPDGTWGSSINLIEGNGSTNTNVWSLARQTTGGVGDSSLRINFGTANRHDNPGLMAIGSNGNVGIGTMTPSEKLHISSGTSGDAILILEADTDNSNEADNPLIEFRQDGNVVGANVGFSENFGENLFGIGTKYPNVGGLRWDALIINTINGYVGIGTTSPDSELAVNGNIHAKEVKVDLIGWPDYVFNEDYNLPALEEVEKYIKEKGHLINIPSAQEVEENGIQLGEMNKLLLEKIEELMLYTISQEKKLQQQAQEIKILKTLEERVRTLENKQ